MSYLLKKIWIITLILGIVPHLNWNYGSLASQKSSIVPHLNWNYGSLASQKSSIVPHLN